MALTLNRTALLTALLATSFAAAHPQVFVVGEKTATAGVSTDFTPTRVPLPEAKLDERGRRDLIRNLEAEQGFAHRALPMGAGLVLQANGQVKPTPDAYKKMLYEKGQSAAPGDRVIVTALDIKSDRIILDFNGGPYAKHRFLRHIELNGSSMPMAGDPAEVATGSRITLLFEGGVPEVSGPEVKALLQPLVDFGVKSSEQAYAETLPPVLKEAIAAHEVLVGMNHRMVLAALGAPENKMREQQSGDPNGGKYEEWIYGHVPQTIRFVRFIGDRVTVVEIAELGKPIVIHDQDEMGGYNAPPNTREVALGDQQQPKQGEDSGSRQAPSLRMPGDAAPADGPNKVQFPDGDQKTKVAPIPPTPTDPMSVPPPSPTAPSSRIPSMPNPTTQPQ